MGKNLVAFFGDDIPPFPSTAVDIDSLFNSRLYLQASGLADQLLPSSTVPTQLHLLTVKIATLLSIRSVSSAIGSLANYFGVSDLSEIPVWKGFAVPVKLRICSCLAHHFNGDSIRALGGLYRVLKTTVPESQDSVLITLAKLQAALGDTDEVQRLLTLPKFAPLRSHLLQVAGIFPNSSLAADVSDPHNSAIAALYNCEHAKCVEILEACVRRDPVRATAGLLNNLFAVYGFYKESNAERKISAVNEVAKFYCPEAGLFNK